MFARVVSESAAALLASCGCLLNERGESGMRDAGGSTFAGIMVDFAVFMARWALSRARADDGFWVFAAIVDLISVAADTVLNEVGLRLLG